MGDIVWGPVEAVQGWLSWGVPIRLSEEEISDYVLHVLTIYHGIYTYGALLSTCE